VRGVIFLDHLRAGAAVFGDLIDVRAFHQPEAHVCVPQAIRRPAIPFPVELQPDFVENNVEQSGVRFWKQPIRWLRIVSVLQTLKRPHRTRRALAVPDTALAAHLDLKDRFA